MAFITLLLSSCLIFGATANLNKTKIANINETTDIDCKVLITRRLPNFIIPKHYSIHLIQHSKKDASVINFIGLITTVIEILHPTRIIRLHAQQPYVKISETKLIKRNNYQVKTEPKFDNVSNNTVYYPIKYAYQRKSQILIIYFNTTLLEGTYILKMKFVITLDDDEENGFFLHKRNIQTTKNKLIKTWLIGTHFQPINARRVLPCWDEPGLKASFHIAIRHYENYTALSNVPVQQQLRDQNMIWTIFQITPAMPTYLVAIMVSNKVLVPSTLSKKWTLPYIEERNFYKDFMKNLAVKLKFFKGNLVTNYWYGHHSLHQIKFAQMVAEAISQLFGIEWEKRNFDKEMISKIDHIVISDLRDDSIQHWGLIFYRTANVIYREDRDPVARKFEVARLVARENVHQWFGNLVSPSRWSYLWLNDGIATLLGTATVDKVFKNFRMLDLFVVQIQHECLHLDTGFIIKPLTSKVKNASKIDSWSRYIKAPVILRMMYMLFDHAFQWGIEEYIEKYKYSSATPNDLWIAIQAELSRSDIAATPINIPPLNISKMMDAWTKQTHYPTLNVKRDPSFISEFVTISVENISDQDNWFIFVTFTTETNINFINHSRRGFWFIYDPQHEPFLEIDLPEESEGWIIVNLQQIGYYRVNYDSENWKRIASYLDSLKYLNIHVLNRAQIIDDAFHFMISGKLESSIFWDLISYLQREKDYIAWYPMIKILERISSIFPLALKKVESIKEKIRYILNKVLDDIGYDESLVNDDYTKCLIQEATKWACTLYFPYCIDIISHELSNHLKDDPEILMPPWKEWIYCKGIMLASFKTWLKLLNLYKKTNNIKILEYSTCSKNSQVILHYLEAIKEDNVKNIKSAYKVLERIYIFFSIVARNIDDEQVFEYILFILTTLKPREISPIAALTYIINHTYSKKRLDKVNYTNSNKQFCEQTCKECERTKFACSIQNKNTLVSNQASNELSYDFIKSDADD